MTCCRHTYSARPWGMECPCGAFVDMGREATEEEVGAWNERDGE
jgi:hypothetical protein